MTFHFSDLYLPFQQTDGAKPPLVCLQSTERNSGPARAPFEEVFLPARRRPRPAAPLSPRSWLEQLHR